MKQVIFYTPETIQSKDAQKKGCIYVTILHRIPCMLQTKEHNGNRYHWVPLSDDALHLNSYTGDGDMGFQQALELPISWGHNSKVVQLQGWKELRDWLNTLEK